MQRNSSITEDPPRWTPSSLERVSSLLFLLVWKLLTFFIAGVSGTTASPRVSSASPFLQNLINEQRAVRETRVQVPSDNLISDSRPRTPLNAQVQEEHCSEKQRKITNALSADLKQPEEMGVREMDQYVHKLNKQNFDLKLEIFHRAQQMDTLKKKLERMQELEEQLQQMRRMEEELEELREVEADNQRLRESNEQLRQELGTQDQAIEEAVDLICDLEARIDELEAERETGPTEQYLTTSPETSETAATSPGPPLPLITPKNKVIFDVPDRTSSRRGTRSTASHSRSATPTASRARRQPSFLRHENESTTALRSVYSSRALSVISQAESVLSGDEERQCPDSPNLSILSECSEFDPNMSPTLPANRNLSVLKPLPQTFELEPVKKETPNNRTGRAETVSRVQRWMRPQETKHVEARTPLKSTAAPKAKEQQPSLAPAFRAERHPRSKLRPPAQDVPLFGSGRFPPTPDTMSTSHANNRNGSNPSIIVEKSQYDSLYTPLSMKRSPRRPRSAGELTSRPSTGSTVDSGMNGYMVDDNYPLASIFPTFAHITPTSSRGRDHEDTAYTTDQSEPDSNKPQASNSPPLTPADWLEAALCTPVPSRKATDSIDCSKELPPPPAGDITPCRPLSIEQRIGSPDTEGLDLPPPASFRVRVADELHSGAKRVLNFKLFGRAVTVSHGPIQNSDAAGGSKSSPSAARLSRRHSTSRRHSAHVKAPVLDEDPSADDEEVSFDDGISPIAFTALPKARDSEPINRPTTAGSLENQSKRRSGGGLFGWMRGSGPKDTSHDPSSAHISPAALAATHALSSSTQNPKKNRAQLPNTIQQPAPRPVSELGHIRAASGGTVGADDGRKPKFHPRRFRKGKEKEVAAAAAGLYQ